jgi:hypothetical protein
MNDYIEICECEFDSYPKSDGDFGEESVHFLRKCLFCGDQWWGLHCRHDGYQNLCPNCGQRPVTVQETAHLTKRKPDLWQSGAK